MKTKIIELYGSPGSGKSTTACKLFGEIKDIGLNVELVRECAKDFAWQNINIGTAEQYYISGKQIYLESSLYNKVDYIITDSPILLTAYYADMVNCIGISKMVFDFYKNHENITNRFKFFINRDKPYNPKGRYQTETESNNMSRDILMYIEKHYNDIKHTTSSNAVNFIKTNIIQ